MELQRSEDQEFFRETTRRFLETEVPLRRVRELAGSADGYERAWWKRACDLGLTSMLVPGTYGGGSLSSEDGSGLVDLALVAEEVGRLVSPGPLLPTNVVAAAVAESGTAPQRDRVLPAVVSGDCVAAWALFEDGVSWLPGAWQVVAEPVGDGFVLRGEKAPVEAGAQADTLLVTARTGDALTQLLVPADTPGVRVTPLESLDLVRRFARVRFDDVRLPGSAAVGAVGGAEADVERQLQIALVLQCAEMVGAVDAVFGATLEYMFDRFSFGRPLASYQALKHRFADMKLWLEASHAATGAAARAVQARSDEAAWIVSAAKATVGERATEIIQECVQMHGGMGVTYEHDIHLYLRRATAGRFLYGSPAEHRERIASLIGMDGQPV